MACVLKYIIPDQAVVGLFGCGKASPQCRAGKVSLHNASGDERGAAAERSAAALGPTERCRKPIPSEFPAK